MALLPQGYLDAVVALAIPDQPEPTWVASGFFFHMITERHEDGSGSGYAYLVSNRHVFEGMGANGVLRVNPQATDADARDFDFSLTRPDGSRMWFQHPDTDVDVAVVPINLQKIRDAGMRVLAIESDKTTMKSADLRTAGISEGDGVYVLGFPLGMVDEKPTAVVRGGCIARIRDLLAGNSKSFLIDTTVFPGNSGGPAILQPEAVAITGTTAPSRANLIGVISSYVPYIDVAVSQQTGRARVTFEENSGLTRVHPIDDVEHVISLHLATLPAEPSDEEEGDTAAASDGADPNSQADSAQSG